jgi:hypothetical protein
MITPRVPSTLHIMECPQCNRRRTTTERAQIGLAIALVEASISEAIATAPKLAAKTRAELVAASSQLLRISKLLSGDGAEPADPDADEHDADPA